MHRLFFSFALLTVLSLPASAQQKLARTYSGASLKDFSSPLSLFTKGNIDKFLGAYSESFAFPLPASRRGLKPIVSFRYSSDLRQTPYGYGWDLTLPRITRSLRDGVPRYVGPAAAAGAVEDQFVFTHIAGQSGKLVRVSSTHAGELYRPERDQLFAKFYYRADGTWKIVHQDGRTWIMGKDDARDSNGTNVFGWYVKELADASQNTAIFEYVHQDGVLWIERITYDAHPILPNPTPIEDTRPKITFSWTESASAAAITSYKKGYRAALDARYLSAVRVDGYDEYPYVDALHRVVHTHSFQSPIPPADHTNWKQLRAITPHDRPTIGYTYNNAPTTLAIHRSYSIADPTPDENHWSERGLRRTIMDKAASAWDAWIVRDVQRLVDMDGDGDLDNLWIDCGNGINDDQPNSQGWATCTWYWREFVDGAWSSVKRQVSLPTNFAPFAYHTDNPADPDSWPVPAGSGLCIGQLWNDACRFSSLKITYHEVGDDWIISPSSGYRDKVKQDLRDMTGDGLADIVYVESVERTIDGVHGNYANVIVCPNTGNGAFSACYVWWTIPRKDEIYLELSYDVYTNGKEQRWVEATFLDFDGDSIPDYVRTDLSSTDKLVLYRIKPASAATTMHVISAPQCVELATPLSTACVSAARGAYSSPYSCAVRLLRDFNGDGLPDLWQATPLSSTSFCATADSDSNPPVSVSPGTGKGFDAAQKIAFNLQGLPLTMNRDDSSFYTGIKIGARAVQTLMDVNADGRPDIVRNNRANTSPWNGGDIQSLTVRYNTGRGFSAEETLGTASMLGSLPQYHEFLRGVVDLTFMGLCNGYGDDGVFVENNRRVSASSTGLVDLNGDGFVEFVYTVGGYPCTDQSCFQMPFEAHWRITPMVNPEAPGKAPHLMSRSATLNATRDITYTLPAEGERPPFQKWTPKTVTITDDVTQETRVTTLTYKDPTYDSIRREFAGFGEVRHSTPKGHTYTLHHQDYPRRGRVFQTSLYDEMNTLRQRVDTTWEVKDLNTAGTRTWARRTRVNTTVYDGSSSQYTFETRKEFAYHDDAALLPAGLLKEIRTWVTATDYRLDILDYYAVPSNDPDRIYLRKKTRKATKSGTLQERVHASTEYYYDDQCTAPSSEPSVGLVCRESVYRGTGEQARETNYTYDQLGRLGTLTPAAQTTPYVIEYHASTPYRRSKSLNLGAGAVEKTYYSGYHPFAGAAGATCGPQYLTNQQTDKCTIVARDDYGRPLEVRKPLRIHLGQYESGIVKTYSYSDVLAGAVPPYAQVTEFPDPLGILGATTPRTKRVYVSGFGEAIQTVTGFGSTWRKSYQQYDEDGRASWAWVPWASNSEQYELPGTLSDYWYKYDGLDRLVEVQQGGLLSKRAVYEGATVRFFDELDNERRIARNLAGETVSVTRVMGAGSLWPELRQEYKYDGAGRVTKATDASEGEYQYDYYADGTVRRSTMPDQAAWTFTRNAAGRATLIEQPTGGTVSLSYDMSTGRLDTRTTSTGSPQQCVLSRAKTEQFTYGGVADPRNLGRVVRVSADRYEKELDYTPLGQVKSKAIDDLVDGGRLQVDYEYTGLGDVYVRAFDGDREVRRYNAFGELVEVETDSGSLWASIGYYAHGRPKDVSVTLTGGSSLNLSRHFDYDAHYRLSDMTSWIDGAQSTIHYTHYANGQIQSMSDTLRNLAYNWTYDAAGRLKTATGYDSPVHGWPSAIAYDYTRNGALYSVERDGQTTQHVHDPGSKDYRLSYTSYAGEHTADYTYTSAGARCQKQTPSGTVELGWTADGRLGSVLREAEGAGPFAAEFYYDEAGERWKKRADGSVTLYLDGVHYDGDTHLTRAYVDLPWTRCKLPTAETPGRCYISDVLNTAAIVSEDGSYPWKVTYTPYGKEGAIAGQPTDLENRFGFNGKEREMDGALMYYGARYYDPEVGRFLSVDPLRKEGVADVLGNGNSLQPFRYANSDPISKFDPNGEIVCELFKNGGLLNGLGITKPGKVDLALYAGCLCLTGQALVKIAQTAGVKALAWLGAGATSASVGGVAAGMLASSATGRGASDGVGRGTVGGGTGSGQGAGATKGKAQKLLTDGGRSARKLLGDGITFGRNPNQVHHAFRHTDKLGLARSDVKAAIRRHLPGIRKDIPKGKPLNQIIEVGGQRIQYSAFRLPDGSVNVGRIHAP